MFTAAFQQQLGGPCRQNTLYEVVVGNYSENRSSVPALKESLHLVKDKSKYVQEPKYHAP